MQTMYDFKMNAILTQFICFISAIKVKSLADVSKIDVQTMDANYNFQRHHTRHLCLVYKPAGMGLELQNQDRLPKNDFMMYGNQPIIKVIKTLTVVEHGKNREQ